MVLILVWYWYAYHCQCIPFPCNGMQVLEPPFSTSLNVILKIKGWPLSCLLLRDLYPLKISVVPICEVAMAVVLLSHFHLTIERDFSLFYTSGYRVSGVTSHTVSKPRCAKSRNNLEILPRLAPRVKFLKP
jgi:hypothetical protein